MHPSQITKHQRLDMVQKGFNPLNPLDIEAYFKKGKPSFELATHVAEAKANDNLGSAKHSESDYGVLQKEFPDVFSDYASDSISSGLDSLKEIRESALRDLRKKSPNSTVIDNSNLKDPKKTKKTNMRPEEAKAIGYKKGVEMVNLFVDVLEKSTQQIGSSSALRKQFFAKVAEIAQIQLKLENQNYNLALAFDEGLCKAEIEFYNTLEGN